jgi:hypothetical protein
MTARRMSCAGVAAHIGEMTNAYRILHGNPEGTRYMGIHNRRWEHNVTTELTEIVILSIGHSTRLLFYNKT